MTAPAAPLDTAPAPAKPAAAWEDLIDVFTSPLEVFRRRRDGRFWLALVAFTVIGALSFVVARPVMQPMMDRQVAAQQAKLDADPNIPSERKAELRAQVRSFVESPWAMAAPAVFLPISLFAAALTLWLVAKLFGSGASLGQAIAVTSIAGIPRVVLGLLGAGASVGLGRPIEFPHQLTLGPGAVVGDVSPVVSGLLQRLDAGVLWHTVLLGLGIAVMGRLTRRGGESVVEGQISRGKGLAAAFVVWALATVITVLNTVNQAG